MCQNVNTKNLERSCGVAVVSIEAYNAKVILKILWNGLILSLEANLLAAACLFEKMLWRWSYSWAYCFCMSERVNEYAEREELDRNTEFRLCREHAFSQEKNYTQCLNFIRFYEWAYSFHALWDEARKVIMYKIKKGITAYMREMWACTKETRRQLYLRKIVANSFSENLFLQPAQ